jgi:hypothetical protein
VSRREIVLLVSRAIAILQFIEALIFSFFSLPPAILSIRLFIQRQQFSQSPQLDSFHETALLVFVRIAVQFFIAWLFWNCGPFIERLLLPATKDDSN